MSKSGSAYNRYKGDDRCQVEKATGFGYIDEVEMDAEFNDFKGALNQVIWRDGSAAMTGNLDINGNNIQNLNQVTGTVTAPGAWSFQNGIVVSGAAATLGQGATVFNGLTVYDNTILDGDLQINGNLTATNFTDTGTYTPTFAATGGTFTYVQQSGSYTRIKNMLFCTITIEANLSGTHAGTLKVDLPIVASGTEYGSASIGQYNGIDGPAVYGRVAPAQQTVNIQVGNDSTDSSQGVAMSSVGSNVLLVMQVIYTV